ncbi:MAG: hypothetical protein N2504_00865 [candidate division WOR-3 bacterium]|nr:hypothetical protein [candidate division WOR-3 bacterium]MCX7947125.1 hypothetical protein [candidate division WOR-3 bacterium]MDW8149834.1 hypothetical protein [candidate division WOR-3 bacterium]
MRYFLFLLSKFVQAIGLGIGFMAIIAMLKGSLKWEFILIIIAVIIFSIGRVVEKRLSL